MQIVPDIYLVAGGVYGENSNVYLINTGKELVLIDSGYDERQLQTIEQSITDWGLSALPITHILFTHCHFDHSGNAAYFERRGVKLYAEKDDAEAMIQGDDRTIGFAFRGRKFLKCENIHVFGKEKESLTIGRFIIEAIHVPGHTRGSALYVLKTGNKDIVFAGDFVLIKGNNEDAVLGWNGGVDYNKKAYFESIKKAKELDCDILLCGHGAPCMSGGSEILNMLYKEALVHLRD